ncbi:hypothetical protein EJ05DRAFT_503325 [Pseudovirgaria hyperparasitica]|uniref:Uncharacterized protein n=1 Tax=Pseudovirgaria hyperparasitica TaxID=470096 RepID=A0A6A6VXQ4_9PEZI|nr:uncharacterized protein EJ05DRAFT_503325 [Pseudovirgaria hyperparasitica]KAF2755013.1 hypothetical protein EJ05DRAFT_503325 [Pseudovirgaria hyperparasitica]
MSHTSLDSLFCSHEISDRPEDMGQRGDEQQANPKPKQPMRAESTLQDSITFSRWHGDAQPLRKVGFVNKLASIGDVITILISCLFFVQGIFVYTYSGVGVQYIKHLKLIEDTAKYGPTVFPILFAAIVGQTMHAAALWRLENGERLQTLDQLLGSTTIFATIMTQLKFQRMGALGVLLIFLWAFSPLGGQASLRIIEFEFRTTSKGATLLYLNHAESEFLPENIAHYTADPALTETVLHGLVHSSLMAPAEMKNSTMDAWGNLKIPFLEAAAKTAKPDEQGWYELTSENTVASSLVGLPMSSLGRTSNSTFKLETQYMYLDCRLHRDYKDTPDFAPWPEQQISEDEFYIKNNRCVYTAVSFGNQTVAEAALRRNSSDPSLTSRIVRYAGINDNMKWSAASCDLRTTYVELDVSCVGRNCTGTRMRESIQAHRPTGWTTLDGGTSDTPSIFLDTMVKFMMCNIYFFQPTFAQRYLTRPWAPYNSTIDESVHVNNLTDETFSWRWTQVWNTFQVAGMGLTTVPNKLPGNVPGGEDAGTVIPGGMAVRSTRVNVTDGEVVLVCNTGWLTLLLVATSIMVLVGVWGVVLDRIRKAPDLAMNISSMIRDNPFVHVPPDGTAMDAAERMRKFRNVRVRIGDIRPMDDVGRIAVSTYSDEQFVDLLHDDRLYS